jgi:hypothetical protein
MLLWATELYLAGRLSFADFMQAVPEGPQDEDVAELVDLIEHEPKRAASLVRVPKNTIGTWSESAS